MFKTVTIIVAGLLSLLAMKKILAAQEAAKVKVRAAAAKPNQALRRLRQDPATGVYYPEV
jgi:hypothetical protein